MSSGNPFKLLSFKMCTAKEFSMELLKILFHLPSKMIVGLQLFVFATGKSKILNMDYYWISIGH